jgi:hypothetical protein
MNVDLCKNVVGAVIQFIYSVNALWVLPDVHLLVSRGRLFVDILTPYGENKACVVYPKKRQDDL